MKARTQKWLVRLTVAPLLLLLTLVSGCATHSPGNLPQTGEGAKEYEQLAGEAMLEVTNALRWLDAVSVQTNSCPPKIVQGFANEVDQLQVNSMRVRARGQAIRARGDAYFEAWSGVNTGAQTPELAEKVAEMKAAFGRIKLASQQAGENFKPFLAGLRKLRTQLELNPAVVANAETRDSIRATRNDGVQVLQKLGEIRDELHAAAPLVLAVKNATTP